MFEIQSVHGFRTALLLLLLRLNCSDKVRIGWTLCCSLGLVVCVVLGAVVGLLGRCAAALDERVVAALLLDGGFQLHVGLLLDRLRRLQLLDQLHLEHLHLHDLLLSLRNALQLLLDLLLDVHARLLDLAPLLLVDLLPRDLLLHLDRLLLVLILLLDVLHLRLQSLLILLRLQLGLRRLFRLRVLDRLHDLLLLLLVHEPHAHILLLEHLLLEFLLLLVLDLLGDALVVALLEAHDVGRALLGLLDLLPGAHFLLLEEGDAVRQHVGVFFHTGHEHNSNTSGSLTPVSPSWLRMAFFQS